MFHLVPTCFKFDDLGYTTKKRVKIHRNMWSKHGGFLTWYPQIIPKSPILMAFSTINHPAMGDPPWPWNPPYSSN